MHDGAVFIYFFNPTCLHCLDAGIAMAELNWKATFVGVPTQDFEFAPGFIDDAGLKEVRLSPDLDLLRGKFPFEDVPYGVAINEGGVVERLLFFEEPELSKQLRGNRFREIAARGASSASTKETKGTTMSADLFNLSGKAALITGGGRGLGKAMARGFAQAGADILIASRTESELEAAAAEVGDGLDVKVEWMSVDMTDRDQVDGLAREAVSRLAKIDILVNNAGTNIPAAIDDIADEGWDQVVELNLSGLHAADARVDSRHERTRMGPRHQYFLDPGPGG